ncbi:FkbM family methyltransferase [Haloferax sp. KTX1]|uniref:FkbM family methyltransferase n=1 Tax=Haloferax sp. KTX1 TaxID=2600597 RepID=UPI0016525793|nr:FkbM family methyltransferase [Haloferax sp. KTX1]
MPEPVAKEKRALDSLVPWQTPSKKSAYERELIKAIRRGVNVGDTVTMIGGGNGVSSVSAAERVDQSGTIYIYEGSKKRIGIIKDVFDINDVSIRFEVFHGVVGPAICVEDDGHEAPRINPESLDECDVLGLDCEGSEVEILENIKISPRMIIVETHAQFDAPAELVREILYEKGYSITHEAIDDPTRGIKILIGTRE